MKAPVVIVPDGLATDETGKACAEPSFAFAATLDHVAKTFSDHSIFIAPANDFGGPSCEQEVAAAYLVKRRIRASFAPAGNRHEYIDTLGNATGLRNWLQREGRWPLPAVILAVNSIHAPRAAYCFSRAGFLIERVEGVKAFKPENARMPQRLFYYRFPALHVLYEMLAFIRDILRIAMGAAR